jgi:dTMP kinase
MQFMPKNQQRKIILKHLTNLKERKGLLIAVEGVDGSGKSTQMQLVNNWLQSNGFATVVTAWASTDTIKPLIKDIKRKEYIVSPKVFSLLHVADFTERLEKVIIPALQSGLVVLCDRYLYTAIARDTARGVSEHWVRTMYDFAPIPDITLYFSVRPDISFARKTGIPNFYEAGMDRGLDKNIRHSFEIFQQKVIQSYEQLVTSDHLLRIDGETDIFVTFPKVKQIIAHAIQQKYKIHL